MIPGRSWRRWRLFLLILASFTVLGQFRDGGRGAGGRYRGLALAAGVQDLEKDEFEDLITKKQDGGEGDDHELEEEEEMAKSGKGAGEAGKQGGSGAGDKARGRGSAGGAPKGPGPDVALFTVYEWCGVAVIALYAVVYLYGRGENDKIKTAWAKQFEELFRHQFAEVGPAELLGPEYITKGELLYKDSESTYLMYATGRRLCRSCLVTLQLRKRHDVFWSLYDLVSPSDDTITLDVVLEDGSMDPFVMAVTRKRDYRALLSQTADLKEFCGEHKFGDLPKGFVVLTDCPSIVPDMLHPPVVKTLLKHESLFQLMHFTDQNADRVIGCESVPKQVARFRFSLPPADRMEELSKLIEMSLYFIDHVSTGVKLSQQAKTRALNIRKEAEQKKFRRTREQRQELLQRKRVEKLEKERQEYDQLTLEQKLKRDARDEKKKAKQGNGRLFRMKMAKG